MGASGVKIKVGVLGAGTMGTGIAHAASIAGHEVLVYDIFHEALTGSEKKLSKSMQRKISRGKISEPEGAAIIARIKYTQDMHTFEDCGIIIEAVKEEIEIKKETIKIIEAIVPRKCIIATNTSSISISSIASACKVPGEFIGAHFFNPAHIMPLVEIIPGIKTTEEIVKRTRDIFDSWGKTTVIAKDTPGFIVNRIARPFYGEAIKIYEEGFADIATIDWAMKEIGGFRMGPFELMDFIGNDVNLKVTESVFKDFFYDPRYRPSFTQKRMVEAGLYGRKSGRGYYDYSDDAEIPEPETNQDKGTEIFKRILSMLINEAVDAVFLNIASPEDIDLAMVKGVNYPKGCLAWADEVGLHSILERLMRLQEEYGEDRYRPSVLMKRMVRENARFYPMVS